MSEAWAWLGFPADRGAVGGAGLLALRIAALLAIQPGWRAACGPAWWAVAGTLALALAGGGMRASGDGVAPWMEALDHRDGAELAGLAALELGHGLVLGAIVAWPAFALEQGLVWQGRALGLGSWRQQRAWRRAALAASGASALAWGLHRPGLRALAQLCAAWPPGSWPRPPSDPLLAAASVGGRLADLLVLAWTFAAPAVMISGLGGLIALAAATDGHGRSAAWVDAAWPVVRAVLVLLALAAAERLHGDPGVTAMVGGRW
jgi:hypothetical protein